MRYAIFERLFCTVTPSAPRTRQMLIYNSIVLDNNLRSFVKLKWDAAPMKVQQMAYGGNKTIYFEN